ncbi:hypothetical protein ECP02989421_4942 [Escherichia coli P0298942.1]|nr:hypothetical protein ECP02989421_4942 [Escherichia coli P0298942.1]
MYLFTVVSEIKIFPAAKQRRGVNNGVKTIWGSTPEPPKFPAYDF